MAEKKKSKTDDFFKSAGEIEKVIGYVFHDKTLLRQAFTRTSYCNEHRLSKSEGFQSNEVLEFFGDGVLSLAIITFLMTECAERYAGGIKTELDEGDFSRIKSRLSDKKNLSDSIRALGLEKYLLLGEGDAKLGVSTEMSVMEDLYESIIGAVYIDSDRNVSEVMRVVERTLDLSSYTKSEPPKQSAKNALQEWCQDKKRRLPIPVYKTVRREGPDHKPVYEEGCYIGGRLVATGIGKSEKLADAKAAEAALEILMKEEEEKSGLGSAGKADEAMKKSNTPPVRAKETAPKPKQEKKSSPTPKKAETPDSPKVKKGVQPPFPAVKRDKNPETKMPSNRSSSPLVKSGKSSERAKNAPSAVSESGEGRVQTTAVAKLRGYAKAHGMLGASFIDLGKGADGLSAVECRFMNKKTTGKAKNRNEAKEIAAKGMLSVLSKK